MCVHINLFLVFLCYPSDVFRFIVICLFPFLLTCVFCFLICQYYYMFANFIDLFSSLFHWLTLYYFVFNFIDFCFYICYFLPSTSFGFVFLFFFSRFLKWKLEDWLEGHLRVQKGFRQLIGRYKMTNDYNNHIWSAKCHLAVWYYPPGHPWAHNS